jgi:hypothetical protein
VLCDVWLEGNSSRGLKGCETSRLSRFLVNRLTDGGEVVSLTRRLATLYPQAGSWYLILLKAESTPGPQFGWKG